MMFNDQSRNLIAPNDVSAALTFVDVPVVRVAKLSFAPFFRKPGANRRLHHARGNLLTVGKRQHRLPECHAIHAGQRIVDMDARRLLIRSP